MDFIKNCKSTVDCHDIILTVASFTDTHFKTYDSL